MAEHQEALQPSFPQQPLEAQEGPQGFAGPWPRVDQDVAALAGFQPAPQQLDQLGLPLPRLQVAEWPRLHRSGLRGDGGGALGDAQVKRQRSHAAIVWRFAQKSWALLPIRIGAGRTNFRPSPAPGLCPFRPWMSVLRFH